MTFWCSGISDTYNVFRPCRAMWKNCDMVMRIEGHIMP